MSINNIKHIVPPSQPDLQNKISNSPENSDFRSLLHEFVEKNRVTRDSKNSEQPYETIQNVNSYSSFNELKVNHIDRQTANSLLVEKILNGNQEDDRKSKVELAKNRIATGFYFRDDIIQDTAGKIIDSFIR